MRKTTAALTLLIALALIVTGAYACPMHGGMGGKGMHGGMMLGMLKGLDLPADKMKDIEKMGLEHHRKMIERQAEMHDIHAKLQLAMTAEKVNQKEIDGLAARIGKFHEEQVKMHTAMVAKVREMLTADQRIRFDAHLLKMGGPGGKHRMMKFGMRDGDDDDRDGECDDCREHGSKPGPHGPTHGGMMHHPKAPE
ncbi:MAG: periplasmic heavy metal sensor [Calditrichaeota bacterium]|nr:periplasmic heavy metal sensor [Calditrichota bacterium]